MKICKFRNTRSRGWVAGLFMLMGAMPAAAADPTDPQDWQFAGVGYRFNKVDGVLGYRYTYWDFDDDGALDDLDLGGPLLGVKFRF